MIVAHARSGYTGPQQPSLLQASGRTKAATTGDVIVIVRVLTTAVLGAALLLASAGVTPAYAQRYPDRPIRIVVPFSPGGAVDGPTRAIAHELSKQLKQQVIIENKPGAGATIGSDIVAKSPADGYTLLLASQTNAISATLYKKLPFEPIEDFEPISL